MPNNYGREVIIDLHECDKDTMTRDSITNYFEDLCDTIGMERCDLHFWDYDNYPEEYEAAPPHLKGVSAIQFITTSNITIHTLHDMKRVYVNVFSCKDFDDKIVRDFTQKWFKGKIIQCKGFNRI